jgi:hypothetical protein
MSTELEQYLNGLQVYMMRLTDGTSIITKILDEDDHTFIVQHPYECVLHDHGLNSLDMSIHSYMFLSDEEEVIIQKSNVISHCIASKASKDFYQKAMLRARLKSMVEREGLSFGSEILSSLFDGLDNQGTAPKRRKRPWPPREDL